MTGPQFSLKTLLWFIACIAVLLAQLAVLDQIWVAFAASEMPVVQLAWLPVIWTAAYFLLVRR